MRSRALAGLLGCIAAAGCAQPAPVMSDASPPAVAPIQAAAPAAPPAPARRCKETRRMAKNEFHIRILVSNEGAPCQVVTTVAFRGGRRRAPGPIPSTSGTITQQPSHGTAELVFEPTSSSLIYTPTQGYVGRDHFTMHLIPFAREWQVDAVVGP